MEQISQFVVVADAYKNHIAFLRQGDYFGNPRGARLLDFDLFRNVEVGRESAIALAHEVPFYVAGPMTTFDPATAGGEGIVIEQRPGDEVRPVGSARSGPDVAVWNPAFDVTPAALITAFITDAGVLRPPYEVSIRDGIAEAARLGLRDPGRDQ